MAGTQRKYNQILTVQLQNYKKMLADKDYSTEQIRKTAKGWKSAKVHTATVWHWDGKEEKAYKRTLVITKSEKTKYSLSNGDKETYTNKEWAYFHCSRYWLSAVLMIVRMSWECQVIK